MIILEQAERLAIGRVEAIQRKIGIPLQVIRGRELPYGWIFGYNSKEFIQTGNFSSALAGNAPFLVDSTDGSIHVFGTAYPLEKYLKDYEISRER